MTTPNLEQIIAQHLPSAGFTGTTETICICGLRVDAGSHAAHVVAAIRDSGLTVIALPAATYGDGTQIAFEYDEYDERRRADIRCTRCLRDIEAYEQPVLPPAPRPRSRPQTRRRGR